MLIADLKVTPDLVEGRGTQQTAVALAVLKFAALTAFICAKPDVMHLSFYKNKQTEVLISDQRSTV